MLKSNFFSAKNFNIFYNFGRKKNPTSAIRSPIKPRKFPIKPRKFPLKHLEIPRCFVLHPLYWAKKRGESPVFRALSSSLVQRYNIFPRNPNRVNISQHFGNVKNEVFYLEFIMMAVSMKRQCTARWLATCGSAKLLHDRRCSDRCTKLLLIYKVPFPRSHTLLFMLMTKQKPKFF